MGLGNLVKNTKVTSHRLAICSTALKAKAAICYTGLIGGGLVLANQVAKIPHVTEGFRALEQKVQNISGDFLLDTAEFAAGAAALVIGSRLIRRSRKRRDFAKRLRLEPEKITLTERIASYMPRVGRDVGLATLGGGLLLASYKFMPGMADGLEHAFHGTINFVSDNAGKAYDFLFHKEGWYSTPMKVIGGVALTVTAAALNARWSGVKHGPIQKRYLVDGYSPCFRWTSGNNILKWIQRTPGRIFRSKALALVSDDLRETATVKIIDYVTREKSDAKIWFDPSQEPVSTKGQVTNDDVYTVKTILLDYATREDKNIVVKGSDVAAIAENIDIYKATTDMYKGEKKKERPSSMDVRRVLEVLCSHDYQDRNLAELDSSEIVKDIDKMSPSESGGVFKRSYMTKDKGGNSVEFALLDEKRAATIKQSKREYGSGFIDRKKILPLFVYRIFRGADKDADIGDIEDGDSELDIDALLGSDEDMHDDGPQSAVNKMLQMRKYANNFLEFGLGQMYTFAYHNEQYTIEESFCASVPVGKDKRLRRKFYVYDPCGDIVAKVVETWPSIIGKTYGNINRIVDIYDTKLAKTDSFGAFLCLGSEFLTHQGRYRKACISELIQETGGGFESTLAAKG